MKGGGGGRGEVYSVPGGHKRVCHQKRRGVGIQLGEWYTTYGYYAAVVSFFLLIYVVGSIEPGLYT